MLTLEILRARHGDCLIVHYGETDAPRMILIDGGPSKVWNVLKPRLEELREELLLDEDESLNLELMMVSHVDDDHINGILDLTREAVAQENDGKPLLVTTKELWHNSFNDILNDDEIGAGAASVQAMLAGLDDATALAHGLDDASRHDTLKILASINQGRQLRDDAKVLRWQVNSSAEDGLIMAHFEGNDRIALDGGLTFDIVGPMQAELTELQEKHDKYLRDKELGVDVSELEAAYADKSVPNLASIVAVLRCDGCSILLTGDARGDKVLEGLEQAGELPAGGTVRYDVLKLMHHGSDRNVTQGFFERVIADHYVFCGDGHHGNPERATLEMLFAARPEGGFALHFSENVAKIDATRKKERLEKEKPWDDARDGLAALLARPDATAAPVAVFEPGGANSLSLSLA
ncbi:hypothetical protein M4578_06315 [Salipiger sp. P9]|uniref:hypothetical protein n=1 Tax=Salipiger pentaromativorans TaxID=2943193 RepID=UPI00215831EB|nr:hypothetical protein [Salipiger pentaromativorans]MCR8547434.1 hypothetical protein [Salipiger pentaromativorans]